MTIKQRVVMSQIEVQPDGTIQVRLDKQMYMPAKKRGRQVIDEVIVQREYHRTVVMPGVDVDDQMAMVDRHLREMGWPPVERSAIERIRRLVTVEHTPDVIEAHKDRMRKAGHRFGDEDDATPEEKGSTVGP